MLCAFQIRRDLTAGPNTPGMTRGSIHTALNIALFPPLFFFSGLYYTDVLSVQCVLLAYQSFLNRSGAENSGKGLWKSYLIGILALTMRQTNIFWVAVFLGGSEAVRTLKSNISPAPISAAESVWNKWARGDIHDVTLEEAEFTGELLKSYHNLIFC